jgi:hypothetical protein
MNQTDQRPILVCPTTRTELLSSKEALLSCVNTVKQTGCGTSSATPINCHLASVHLQPLRLLPKSGRVAPTALPLPIYRLSHRPSLACHPVPERGGTDCGLRPPVLRCPDAELHSNGAAPLPRCAGLIRRSQLWAPAPTAGPRCPELQSKGAAPLPRSAVLSGAVFHPEKATVGTCPDGCPAPRLMMRVSHSEKNRLTKCDSSVLVDACKRIVNTAISEGGNTQRIPILLALAVCCNLCSTSQTRAVACQRQSTLRTAEESWPAIYCVVQYSLL